MNNTYEHTTLAQFTEWMGTEHTILGTFWFPHGEFGIWTVDFYEHIWGYGSSHAFSSCDLIRAVFVDSSPRNSYLATLPICQDRMNAMPSSHNLYRSFFAGVFFSFLSGILFYVQHTAFVWSGHVYHSLLFIPTLCSPSASHGDLQIIVSPYDTMSKMIPKSSLHNSISKTGHLTRLRGKFLHSIYCLQQIYGIDCHLLRKVFLDIVHSQETHMG